MLGDSSVEAATTVEGPLILSSWGTDLDDTLVGWRCRHSKRGVGASEPRRAQGCRPGRGPAPPRPEGAVMGVGALFTQGCDGLRAGSTGPHSLASRTARLGRYPCACLQPPGRAHS